ncbi:cupin domain-containing protein [Mycobacterium sp. AZCC_0083]|uniref:cupin domain-containing protein n=1 Tax=Mycobacterium sp. AZCC_0083 TaxID=2735882 RepID=UPI00161950E1|nr:cupin domain-containing protein [Mycobacterium sp. AZCC_0083]MBB5166307.1 mannose-6-phosphate isomerase-like protein (cupin superfamily) [Mycobacterium sp. AZCC_0083]
MTHSLHLPHVPRRLDVVHRSAGHQFLQHPSEPGHGAAVAPILTPEHGAENTSIALVDLTPDAQVSGHRHPFEESFFVLEGNPLVAIADKRYALRPNDFGLIPHGTGHAWRNPSDQRARLLRVHAPQPRPIGGKGQWGVFEAAETAPPTHGEPVDELDPAKPYVGHFEQSDMAPPGSISMPGYHGANVQNVQIRMMVDELLGARHHAMFIVQFTPASTAVNKTANEHFHPFEEAYYLLSGGTQSFCDGENQLAAAGDLIFAPVGASHGFAPLGGERLCWIEVQSPLPPASNAFVFHNDWTGQTNLG